MLFAETKSLSTFRLIGLLHGVFERYLFTPALMHARVDGE